MVNPIRIAFVITELEIGGAERCLVNLATGIDRQRFAPIVCSLAARPGEGKDLLIKQLEVASVPVHFLNLQSPRSFFVGLSKLKQLFRQHDVDVVQTFLFHANVLGALAARSAGVSQIASGIRVADPARWRMKVERFAMRFVDHIVCVSESVADFVTTKGRFPAIKLRVIPNGIDLTKHRSTNTLTPTQLGIPSGRRLLLYVGRLHAQKGLDWLLETAPELFERLPEHDLIIVGEGPARRSLGEIIVRRGIRDRVHFVGWRADVPDLMRAADILLLPSRWEGMPNVLLEAMGAGMAVVATDVEGVAEVFGPLADCQTVPPGDTAAFIDLASRIACDRAYREKLGNQNYQRIQAEFSLSSMIAKYEALYSNHPGRVS